MIVAISISPSGGDPEAGVADKVAEAVQFIRDSGLPNETNSMFTNIEGSVARKGHMTIVGSK